MSDDSGEEDIFRDLWEDETQREVVIDSLKAECEVRVERPPNSTPAKLLSYMTGIESG